MSSVRPMSWGSGEQPSDAELVDGAVLKKPGPWAPGVIALLRHLERAGFAGAPRVVGTGFAADGRLATTYVPGASPHPGPWPDGSVGEIGALLRGVHDATQDFAPPAGVTWQSNWLRELGGDDLVIGHGDTGPWNVVGRDGRPEAFVDWEYAGPVSRSWELAATIWLNAQLHDDDIAERHGLPDAAARARHVRAILDGYGLPRAERPALVDRLADVAAHSARAEVVAARVTPESTAAVAADGYPVLWGIAWRARSASWIARHRELIRRHACSG